MVLQVTGGWDGWLDLWVGFLCPDAFYLGMNESVQKIQKLPVSPVTSHVIAKICAHDSTTSSGW